MSSSNFRNHNNYQQSEYEKYLESIIDTIREALLILDKNLRVVSANKTFYQRFKVNKKDTEGILVYELGNGQWNIPDLKKLLEDILPSHNPFNGFRVEYNFPKIGRKVMLLNARQIKEKGSWQDRVLLAIEDITLFDKDRQERDAGIERERSISKELKKSEQKFKTLADNIPNLCWMADADGYIYWYNSRWYEYTGKKPAEMVGWGWKSVHDPAILPKVLERWKNSLKTGVPFEMIFPLKSKTGEYNPFLTLIVPVHDEKGKVIQWFGTNTNVSKQVELERQKDEFLGIASHELKTPVTSIKAYGQVLQTMFQRKGDVKAVEALQKMDSQINKLTNLIGDLLDVTKIQSGRLEFHKEYFDFNELVYEIIDEMQLTTERHILTKDLAQTKSVYGDRERIGQVLINLISNAIKYSPHTDKIIITTNNDKGNVKLCVQDFGVGIPKEKQDKIFEQFFRISGPHYNTVPGLGLGLYISSEIIKRQKGKIWVESIVGKGSSFCFSLPISKKKTVPENKNILS